MNCLRCSATYSTVWPTSWAKTSFLSSLRVSLSTKTSGRSMIVTQSRSGGPNSGNRCEILADRKLHQAGKIIDVQFSHQAAAESIDGLRAHVQAGGDLLGPHALHEQRKDLVLPEAEGFEGRSCTAALSGDKDFAECHLG